MIEINDLIHDIDAELEDAQKYAERYSLFSDAGNNEYAHIYHSMAHDELEHAMSIHKIAVELIDKAHGSPTQEMLDTWKAAHKRYMENVALIKNML